jgi:hypothetical protein
VEHVRQDNLQQYPTSRAGYDVSVYCRVLLSNWEDTVFLVECELGTDWADIASIGVAVRVRK